LEQKNKRVKLLTEFNRETNISVSRLSHISDVKLDISIGRSNSVKHLLDISCKRKKISESIDIKQLWKTLHIVNDWIDLNTITQLCFFNNHIQDNEAAVVRALFENRLYFKFKFNRFFPNSEKKIQHLITQRKAEEKRKMLILQGAEWLKKALKCDKNAPSSTSKLCGKSQNECEKTSEIINILKSFYILEKESNHYLIGSSILNSAKLSDKEYIFKAFVNYGIWKENIDINLLRYKIPVSFSPETEKEAEEINFSPYILSSVHKRRKDLTQLHTMTIDGQSTLDFDDAISIEEKVDHYILGVHITDVGHFIEKGKNIDNEAKRRVSSIYLPDKKISMLPIKLSEEICSLKKNHVRLAISIMIKLDRYFNIKDYEIIPSIIKVYRQLTYYDANLFADKDEDIINLYKIAKAFRQKRFDKGAIHITLPEINVWLSQNNEININRINRESPSRMLISEIMIMANWIYGRFLKDNTHTIFRAQPEPRKRLYKENKGTLFQNWAQRKHIASYTLGTEPETHSGLGLEVYCTATSPIRKYSDLVNQRQVRAILGLETPYTLEEIEEIINMLAVPISYVSKVQSARKRYWLLKYLERKIGDKEDAIVIEKRYNNYLVILVNYMLTCNLPISSNIILKPEQAIQVTIQYANARRDILSIHIN